MLVVWLMIILYVFATPEFSMTTSITKIAEATFAVNCVMLHDSSLHPMQQLLCTALFLHSVMYSRSDLRDICHYPYVAGFGAARTVTCGTYADCASMLTTLARGQLNLILHF